jgi:oxygen-independent coproporphyrinogen-3 oxidase
VQDREEETAGIYVHIPWCRSICTYCDFDRQAHAFELIPSYVEALVTDIGQQPGGVAHSVFFGGGTPSLLEADQISAVLNACRDHFALLPTAEITVEANPGDLDPRRVAVYAEAGVNRFSIGVQSFDDRLLRLLGRRHTSAEAVQAVHAARVGGASNLSLDLMYALPGQTSSHWRETLERALELQPDHLSAYLLTVDERVPLGRQVSRGTLSLPRDDDVAQMYRDAQHMLGRAGYEQYEISNWARPGRASRHNLTYWRDEPYLGLGAGAASCFGGRRYKNGADPAAYIEAIANGRPVLVQDESTDRLTAAQDHVGLGLRLIEGIDLGRYRRRFGRDLLELGGEELAGLVRAGVLAVEAGRLRLAPEHLLVSNEVILRLHSALEERWDRPERVCHASLPAPGTSWRAP